MNRPSALKAVHPASATYRSVGDSEVPWTFTDLAAEYGALRSNACLFDLSSVGLLAVTGDTETFLRRILPRDAEYLAPEQSMMSLLFNEAGAPVDVVTIYGLDDAILIETSFGRGASTLEFLQARAADLVEIQPLNEHRTVLGIEGPYAWGIVGRLIDQEFTALPYESVVETDWEGEPILLCRSGFTGEYGYKLILSHDTARRFWVTASEEAMPGGQELLEVAMLEVRQPLIHREADGDDFVACGWNWLIDLSKDDYIGRESIENIVASGAPVRTVGFRGEGATAPAAGTVVLAGGTTVGRVVHAAYSPGLQGIVGLARVRSEVAAAGIELCTGDDGGRVRTVSSPYVVPASWSVPIF